MSEQIAQSKTSPDEQLLAVTREMFEHATAGEWEQLAELEKSRLPLFHQIFAKVDASNEKLAREVLSIDEKTKSLAEKAMPAIKQEMLNMRNSGKAKNAYQAVQSIAIDK